MGVDRRNYVVTVEAAMAREMAFRNKLQGLGMEAASSSKDPLHSQVPTGLVQNQRTGLSPGSMPPPFAHAHASASRSWSPTLSADQISVSAPIWKPTNLNDQKRKAAMDYDKPVHLGNFFCLLCKIDCTTSHNLMMHYQGQRHRAKLSGQPQGKKLAGGSGLSTSKERLYCNPCGIWCKDEFAFKYHLQCKNHGLTLQEHEKRMKKPM